MLCENHIACLHLLGKNIQFHELFPTLVVQQARAELQWAAVHSLPGFSLPQVREALLLRSALQSLYSANYLDPRSMSNNGLLGYFERLWAIVLHTIGVQVMSIVILSSAMLFEAWPRSWSILVGPQEVPYYDPIF